MDWQTGQSADGERAQVSERLAEFGEELLALWRALVSLRNPEDEISVLPIGAEAERLVAELAARQAKTRALVDGEVAIGGKGKLMVGDDGTVMLGSSAGVVQEKSGLLRRERAVENDGEMLAMEIARTAGFDTDLDNEVESAKERNCTFERSIGIAEGGAWRDEAVYVIGGAVPWQSGGSVTAGLEHEGRSIGMESAVSESGAFGQWRGSEVASYIGGSRAIGNPVGGYIGAELSESELERICERVAERLCESIEVYLQSAAIRG